MVKNNLSSFYLERHTDGVNVAVGGGQQGLENNFCGTVAGLHDMAVGSQALTA